MKAAVYHGPGDVCIEQVPDPGPPQPNEVVLQVQMGALCGTDASQFKAATMVPLTQPHPVSGHHGPIILGHEVTGVIVEKGAAVTGLAVGQRVVPGAGWWCGACPQCRAGRLNICEQYYVYGLHAHGGLAEYATFPAKMCIPVPDTCSVAAAAIAQPCAVALHALRRADIKAGQTVALFGVGSIGSLLLAVLRAQRVEVSVLALDVEPQRLTTAEALGATSLIQVHDRNPMEAIQELTQGRGVDIAIEATGEPETITPALASVGRGGTLLQVGIPQLPASLALAEAVVCEKNLIPTNGQITTMDLPQALHLLAETDLAALVGTHIITLDALVEKGLRPLAEHRAAAKVLVQVGPAFSAPHTYQFRVAGSPA